MVSGSQSFIRPSIKELSLNHTGVLTRVCGRFLNEGLLEALGTPAKRGHKALNKRCMVRASDPWVLLVGSRLKVYGRCLAFDQKRIPGLYNKQLQLGSDFRPRSRM